MTGELAHSLLKWNAWKWMGSIALVDGNGIDGDNHVVVVVVNTLLLCGDFAVSCQELTA
jgi:hypothetical protein